MNRLHSSVGALAAASFALTSCASVTGGQLLRKDESPATFVIQNNSGVGIDVVTLSRCSAMSYGLNRLGGQQSIIPHRSSMSFTVGAGCWDVMVGRSGTCAEVSGTTSCAWLQSPAHRFNIVAGGRYAITYGPQL